MLEPDFVPPDSEVARRETAKRNDIISWFGDYMHDAVEALVISGSMAYGQNYSVTEKSDIDCQIFITPNDVDAIAQLDLFSHVDINNILEGYAHGYYQQFSINAQRNSILLECHFWDHEARIAAITYDSQITKRLRSGIETPSTDHAFSFDAKEDIQDYYGEYIDGYAVGDFPSFRYINHKTYLCRAIANVLATPLIIKTTKECDDAVDTAWQETAKRLTREFPETTGNLSRCNIANALPGKNKISQENLERIEEKTRVLISRIATS